MNSIDHLDHPLSPLGFMAIVSRRLGLIILLFMLIAGAIVGAAFVLPPVYESTAKVMVNFLDDYEKQNAVSTLRTGYDPIATEISIFNTRAMLEPVIDELGLQADEPTLSPEAQRNKVIDYLQSTLKIEREKDTNVLTVTYVDSDPKLAADVVNAVVRQYEVQRPRLSKDARAAEFFDKEIAVLAARIDSLEAQSLLYKKTENVVAPNRQSEIMFASMADFDRELTRVRAERIAREARVRVLNQQSFTSADYDLQAAAADGEWSRLDHLNQLRQTLLTLKNKQNGLRLKYTDKHPEMEALRRDMENTEAEISRQVQVIRAAEETNLRMLRAQEDELARSMREMAAHIADLSRQEYELGRRTVGIEDLKLVYSALLRQREEARIVANKKEFLVQVRILDPAKPAAKPAKPNKKLYVALALIIGSFVSVGAAFFIEYFDHSIYTAEDAMHSTGLPIIAVIAEAEPRRAALQSPRSRVISSSTFSDR